MHLSAWPIGAQRLPYYRRRGQDQNPLNIISIDLGRCVMSYKVYDVHLLLYRTAFDIPFHLNVVYTLPVNHGHAYIIYPWVLFY